MLEVDEGYHIPTQPILEDQRLLHLLEAGPKLLSNCKGCGINTHTIFSSKSQKEESQSKWYFLAIMAKNSFLDETVEQKLAGRSTSFIFFSCSARSLSVGFQALECF